MERNYLDYWEARSRLWHPTPPLSPAEADIAFFESVAHECRGDGSTAPMNALLLGVTPTIATMSWPPATSLVAVDWASGMIERGWPRRGLPEQAAVIRGDWRQLPLRTGSRDIALGDGCHTALGDYAGAAQLNQQVREVLRPGGFFAIRCFCRPDEPLDVAALFEELFDGAIEDLDFFRWRLSIALQGGSRDGVSLNSVWAAWHERVPGGSFLHERLGQSPGGLTTLESWKGVDMRYYFPSIAELVELAHPYFEIERCDIPNYPWGGYFPRLLMRAIT